MIISVHLQVIIQRLRLATAMITLIMTLLILKFMVKQVMTPSLMVMYIVTVLNSVVVNTVHYPVATVMILLPIIVIM